MKIDITSKQVVVGVESSSASKLQQNNAKILFGRNAAKVLKALEVYSKEKMLDEDAVDGIKLMLLASKSKNTELLEKFAQSSPGKKLASNCLKLANAKTPAAMFAAIKSIKGTKGLNKIVADVVENMPLKLPNQRTSNRTGSKRPMRQARVTRKSHNKKVKSPSVEVAGIPMSREFAMGMPVNVMNLLESLITPALAKRITKTAEEGEGVSMRGLGYAKIKRLIDAMPDSMLVPGEVPDFVSSDETGAVTAIGVGDSGEYLGYYAPKDKSAMFRVVVYRDGFSESGIVSIES